MARYFCPVPGERNRDWLFRARAENFEFRNPMGNEYIARGREPQLPAERNRAYEKMLGLQRGELAKKWER
jgi:hypothetical protein